MTASERIRAAREAYDETAILEAVRDFRATGGFYDDDCRAYVSERLGLEPSRDLDAACYRAKGGLDDEKSRHKLDELTAAGFTPVSETVLKPGRRYEYIRSTMYVGRTVPSYGDQVTPCRAIEGRAGMVAFLPGRNRTNGFYPSATDLVRVTA